MKRDIFPLNETCAHTLYTKLHLGNYGSFYLFKSNYDFMFP